MWSGFYQGLLDYQKDVDKKKEKLAEKLEKRMERFESEMMYKINFNYVIVNNKLNDAVNSILKIIN